MVSNLCVCLVGALVVAACKPGSDIELVPLSDWGDNLGNLDGYYHAPKQLPSGAPLVVVLHGCWQDATGIARLSGWNALADAYQFAVLYPQQRRGNNVARCFNWFRPEDITKHSGEARSIRQMIAALIESLSLDSTKVFVTGLSAGGAMTSVMLATYPEAFRAGAVMSGMPYAAAADLAAGLRAMKGEVQLPAETWAARVRRQDAGFSGRYPALAIFHGMKDGIVNEVNAGELAKQWGGLHEIDLQAPFEAGIFDDDARIEHSLYRDDAGSSVLLRYDIDGLGHAIAVDPGAGPKQGGSLGLFAKDMDFHSSFWAARFFGLTDRSDAEGDDAPEDSGADG